MTKIKLILNKIKINQPMMLFWSVIPLVILIVSTNYIFSGTKKVLGEHTQVEYENLDLNKIQSELSLSSQKVILGKNGQVTLIFSGATKKQFEVAYPLLKANSYLAMVSATTSEIGSGSKMSVLDLRLLQNQGWEIVSQSRNQVCDKNELNKKDVVDAEVQGSKTDLSDLGILTNNYMAPCGLSTNILKESVLKNYKTFITFGIVPNSKFKGTRQLTSLVVNNSFKQLDIERVVKTIKQENNWMILTIPEIVEEDGNISDAKLEMLIGKIKSEQVQVLTIGQVLKY